MMATQALLQIAPITARTGPSISGARCKRAGRRSPIAAAAGSSSELSEITSCRRGVLASAAAFAALLPASASLATSRTQLFGDYYENTEALLEAMQKVIDVDPEAEDYKSQVSQFRTLANQWTGDYRRTMSLGRKSFAETTSAVSTLTGFYTSRGPEGGKLPAKVRTQADAKIAAANAALKREKAKSGASPEKAPTTAGRT